MVDIRTFGALIIVSSLNLDLISRNILKYIVPSWEGLSVLRCFPDTRFSIATTVVLALSNSFIPVIQLEG